MDEIIKQFKQDFKERFKCEFPDSHLLLLVEGELEERKKSMIRSQLLGRTTSDLASIALLLEKAVNQSLDRQSEPTRDIQGRQILPPPNKKNKKH